LSIAQQQQLDAALAEIDTSKRTDKRAARRLVLIAHTQAAHATADAGIVAAFERKVLKAEVRQARIYFDALNEAEKKGIPNERNQWQNFANRKLLQAGLNRLDDHMSRAPTSRDREAWAMEDELRRRLQIGEYAPKEDAD
jgi:hypothetical protein